MSFDDRVASIPVHVSKDTELVQLQPDGTSLDILFWFVDGAIRIHPSRLEAFRQLVVAGRVPVAVPSRTG